MLPIPFRLIKNYKEHESCYQHLDRLLMIRKRTEEEQDEVDILYVLLEHFERKHFPNMGKLPQSRIADLMKRENMKPADLARLLGMSRGYISDLLNGKKEFSKRVIQKLALHFNIRQEDLN
ncbi:MAG: transcriptional regulator, family [Ferruginibacter sp.]|nr:transcriptional regulator, family [Ferruginibacter sp.]